MSLNKEEKFQQAKKDGDAPARSGVLFVGLNVLRLLTMVTLVLVITSQILALASDVKAVKADKAGAHTDPADPVDVYDCDYFQYSAVPTQAGGEFWSILNRIFIVSSALVLLVSELSIPVRAVQAAYMTYLPVLSDLHGLGFLGISQIIVAVNILSRYVQSFEQISAWMLVITGGFNGIAGILLRKSAKEKRLIFSWSTLAQLSPQTRAIETALNKVTVKTTWVNTKPPKDSPDPSAKVADSPNTTPPEEEYEIHPYQAPPKTSPDDEYDERPVMAARRSPSARPRGARSPQVASNATSASQTLVNNTPIQQAQQKFDDAIDHVDLRENARAYQASAPAPRRSDESARLRGERECRIFSAYVEPSPHPVDDGPPPPRPPHRTRRTDEGGREPEMQGHRPQVPRSQSQRPDPTGPFNFGAANPQVTRPEQALRRNTSNLL